MKLYMTPGSGNAYKVRLLLALLNTPHENVVVDFAGKEHKQPAFLKLNPRGQVPVLEDAGTLIWDSAACLVYVARKYGDESWLPLAPAGMAEVMQWLALAGNEIQFGLQYARRDLNRRQGTPETLQQYQATGRVALDALQARLENNDWLALGHPSIADIACFPYVDTAAESGVPLEPYPGITAWLARCKALPRWPAR